MDVSPAAMVQAVVANQQADVAQKVQIAMLQLRLSNRNIHLVLSPGASTMLA